MHTLQRWGKKIRESRITVSLFVIPIIVAGFFIVVHEIGVFQYRFFSHPSRAETVSRHDAVLSPAAIAPWMTIFYIEKVYHLPPGYLQMVVPAIVPQYPHITLRRYAEAGHLPVETVVKHIQAAVIEYRVRLAPSPLE